MRVTFLQNLGTTDAAECKKRFGTAIDASQCRIGETVELPDPAAEFLAEKYPALFEATSVRGQAKKPEVTAPAK